ncbi:MAG: putative N-acetyl-LL-diaminopimelate aminotransferase [Verrucomicrobia subdivision 3 bacterium]|nr:putative N-acetyl-LL-diaminopimelate aminotransferase [Limisphaerales bacterium]MCS1416893.1 putative N-acetyl-LL-diaminopimelate aminotransferase [Limisphaerales bacterium]
MSEQPDSTNLIAEHIAKIPRSGIRDYFEIVQTMDDVISLGVGEPDFATPWHIREATIYALERGRTSYTSNLGMPRLRQAIANYITRKFEVSYDPEKQILVTVGVSEALDLALRALINPGDEVLYHEPSYVSYHPSIAMVHGVPRSISCTQQDQFALSPEAIRTAVTSKSKVLILNFPTNPTGGTLTREQLQAIANIASEHDLTVIADEIYAELTYEREHISIASLPGMQERTVFLHGLSKAFAMTGYRLGYACGPDPIIEAMLRIHQYSMLCASILSQDAAIEALNNGEPACNEMRDHYCLRRNFVVRSFNEMGLECHLPRGSFYAFPSIMSTGQSSRDFALGLLKAEKVACVPGNVFGTPGEGFIRCCFATSFEKLEIAMERMKRHVETVNCATLKRCLSQLI